MSKDGIVISTRVRLARNLKDYPFPAKLDSERSLLVSQKVHDAANTVGKFSIIRVSDMDEIKGEALKEMHLISEDLLKGNRYAALVLNSTQDIAIMVNEEDHIRIQAFSEESFVDAFEKASKVDDAISSKMKIAFSPKLGYLTACPTNVGTGLRASALMFLPGLALSKTLEQCVNVMSRLDMTIRGEFGEGSEGTGYLFQISNQKTLGTSEDEIISSVSDAVGQIAEKEKVARDYLMQDNRTVLTDRIMRSYGVLSSSYSLDGEEFMEKLAMVKLGIYYNLLEGNEQELNGLIRKCQPANMAQADESNKDASVRDISRARMVRKYIKENIKIKE